ncbi:type I restriction endonuclease subunit R [Turneriella parva]|uniref:Restriction endonuclease, type I, EcoRI, R subunit/Type III n=1 Tax=Turneriella parva (strain ATCC BAA-1111 / DSM 21527 / NCTC 11395 / H) TaxID=869212 RepID=I4B0A9_TURPD|nr:DEAD/DEAH box helicase family protein [Turneriella parva]AFM10716.1 Restriction endonuclease, type I, EcoRI, R subunit/Type III [Turneriella parva DSM 21527]
MSPQTNEAALETAIEHYLLNVHKYKRLEDADFSQDIALFKAEIIAFVKDTQAETYATIERTNDDRTDKLIIDDLVKALNSLGALEVMRHGFKCFGRTIRIAYFQPAHGMTPELEELFHKNRFRVIRQLHYSSQNRNSLDMVIVLNGIPIITVELKNHFTGQNVSHARRQYQNDRDPREIIFTFKKRTLVHFAVDPDLVYMTTKLNGASTYFLPFNKGQNEGAGNPVAPAGKHRTHYLWEDVFSPVVLLDIIGRFLHIEKKERQIEVTRAGKSDLQKVTSESLIFPRYHQLDVVRKLLANAKAKGPGRNYLVQHSAGSGKSNSIAWLAHRLSSLHNDKDEKIFHTVIVITDRLVLDRQLQETIYQFEHKQGVVVKIDRDSAQLAEAIQNSTPIIVTTLQKFPFAASHIERLESRNFAIIVDEAHSSQSGEAATEVRHLLSMNEIEQTVRQRAEEEDLSDIDEAILKAAAGRSRQKNLSYFAFTATPKEKTLSIFDEPGENGNSPFHLYSMRQAIQEHFIKDVLENYTTYKTYYKLVNTAGEDPLVPKSKAAKALARFMSLHPHNIAQKTEVMIEHFRHHTMHKIGGRAKAMVVTSSRLHAVRYKEAFDKYIQDNNYQGIKTLVAFSGTVIDKDIPGVSYTEVGMNGGIKEKELPEKFATNEYQVLLVAEKYQTGFDQPLLHTMYVDKRLAGIQAVQTLSRLNRTHAGKEDTFVLDFYNETEDIFESFKPYYKITESGGHADYARLAELKSEIDTAQILHHDEIDAFCNVFFAPQEIESKKDHGRLESILQSAVDRFKDLATEAREDYRAKLKSFQLLYSYLSQMVPFQDAEYEKYYTVIRYYIKKLPLPIGDPIPEVDDDINLKYYRLQKISEGRIDLESGTANPLKGPMDVGTGNPDEEKIRLSELVDMLNERFGTDFTQADQLFFDQVAEEAVNDEALQAAGRVNTLDNFKLVFDQALMDYFIKRMDGNEKIFTKLMNDESFRAVASGHLLKKVYGRIREDG